MRKNRIYGIIVFLKQYMVPYNLEDYFYNMKTIVMFFTLDQYVEKHTHAC